jgi:hypothetical protein
VTPLYTMSGSGKDTRDLDSGANARGIMRLRVIA